VCLNTTTVSACSRVYKGKSEKYECFSALPNGYIKISFNCDCFFDEIDRNDFDTSFDSCKVEKDYSGSKLQFSQELGIILKISRSRKINKCFKEFSILIKNSSLIIIFDISIFKSQD